MKIINKYLCDICGREYHKPAEAEACEKKGYPKETEHIKVGDTVDFWCQHKASEVGSLETYSEEKGVVLHKFTAFNDKLHDHVDLMICDVTEPDGVKVERQVLVIDVQNEGRKLFSPSMFKYKPGYAEVFKKSKQ